MRPVVNQGLLPPPPGVTPDFRRRTDVQQAIVVVYGTTFALATVTLALRLYTAACIIGKIRLDTVIIVLAWLVSIVFFACTLRAMPSGFGRHLWDVTAAQVQDYLTRVLSIAIPYIWVPTLAKLAILVLYHRIDPAMLFPYCLPLIGASVVAYTVVCSAVLAGPCNPSHVGSGTCLNNVALAQAVLNIVTDAVLIVVPVPMVYRLHMPLRQKMTVAVLLAVGSAVVVISCVRISYIQKMLHNPDITWTGAAAAIWSCAEINVAIVCSCLAVLMPFVRRHLPRLARLIGGFAPPPPRPLHDVVLRSRPSSGRGKTSRSSSSSAKHSRGSSTKSFGRQKMGPPRSHGGVSGSTSWGSLGSSDGDGGDAGGGADGGFVPWRSDGVVYSYHLRRVDTGEVPQPAGGPLAGRARGEGKDILVVDEVSVRYSSTSADEGASSADDASAVDLERGREA